MADDLKAPERVRLAALDEYGWDWPSPAPDDDPSAVTYVRADIYEALESLNRGQEEQLEIQGNELARRASHGHALRDRIEALERERDDAVIKRAAWELAAKIAEAALATARADALREAAATITAGDTVQALQRRILALIDAPSELQEDAGKLKRTIAARDRRIARLVGALNDARAKGYVTGAETDPAIVLSALIDGGRT